MMISVVAPIKDDGCGPSQIEKERVAMYRFLALVFLFLTSLFAAATVEAQELPMPERGEVLELRTDDPRFREGFRGFIFGNWVSGMDGFDDVLDRVNADLEGEEPITMEQLDAANPCTIIYHGDAVTDQHNGSCTGNRTAAPLSFAAFCAEASDCARWPIATITYHIPAEARLTPGEEAERMASEIDEAAVTDTVPAPDWLAERLARLRELRASRQPPTNAQEVAVIEAIERALARTPSAPAEEPVVDMVFEEPAHAEIPVPEIRTVTVATPFYTSIWFWVFVVASGLVCFLIGRKTGTVRTTDDGSASQAAQDEISRLSGKLTEDAASWKREREEHAKQLNAKRSDDAAEAAKNRENAELVELIKTRWSKFAGQVKASVKLNVTNITKMFDDLEQLQILRSVWPVEFGLFDRKNLSKLINDATEFQTRPEPSRLLKERVIALESEREGMERKVREAGMKAEADNALIDEKSSKVEELTGRVAQIDLDLRENGYELDKERKLREEAEGKNESSERTNFNLMAALKAVTEDTLAMLTPFHEKNEDSPTWALSARTTIDAIDALFDEQLAPFREAMDKMFGEQAMVPAGVPLEDAKTSVGPRPTRRKRPTGGYERPPVKGAGNGASHEREPSWGSDPPVAPRQKGTLPPGAGLYGLRLSDSDRESLAPAALPRVVEHGEENGTEPESAPIAEQPSGGSAPGTDSLFDEVSDDLTKRRD